MNAEQPNTPSEETKTDLVKVVISEDEYESDWDWVIYIPAPQWAESVFRSNRNSTYDIPRRLAEKYQEAIRLRDEADQELAEIVNGRKRDAC